MWIEGSRDGVWSFRFSEAMENIQEELYDLADSMSRSPSKAERVLRRMIEKERRLRLRRLPSTCVHPLVWKKGLKRSTRSPEEWFVQSRRDLPEKFSLGRSQLPWDILENRPFLRMYESLGSRYLRLGMLKQATEVFENIVTMNPDDNQGVRETLCSCYFRQADPEAGT